MAASNTITYTWAAEAAAEIVSQKLEMLLSHPVCLRCSLTEPLAKEAREKLAMIQEFFSTRDSLSPSTVRWLGRLLQAMYDAEEFIDKFHLREARGRHKALHMATRPPATLISKCKLRRDLSNLVNKMRELCQDQCFTGKEAKGKTRKASPASVLGQDEKQERLTSLWDWQASINSLWREKKEEIKERIGEGPKSGNLGWTFIRGEPGAGKTSIARWVYREAMYLGFKWRAWVHLSPSMDMQEFLFEVLKQIRKLARELKDMNLQEMTEIHPHELAKWKKFLIVLDGVHTSNVQLLGGLARILRHGQGHIIITTQDDLIANTMGGFEKPIEPKKLNQQESREMLSLKLRGVPDGQKLSNEEEAILETCQGSLLRISLILGLLPHAGKQERAALAKDGSKMSLLDLLKLSYQKLPAPLKPCFIYMVLFPRATPIRTRKLVRLWLAEGLLDMHCCGGEWKTTRAPEDVGETFILELAERNMIDVASWRADGSPKTCHMLNSLYDVIRPIAMDTGFLYVHDARKSKDENDRYPTGQQQELLAQPRETKVRWLAEHTNIVRDSRSGSNPDLNLRYVRSFLSFFMRRGMLTKDISTFLRKMTSKTAYRLLRVLDLEGVYKPSLHGVLHKLVLLKYLGLRSTALPSIPRAVADLQYLETLDIKDTCITSLPNSFWMARNLRHLHLNWFYINLKTIFKARSNNVMALSRLQTLSGLVMGEVKENSVQMDSLTKLKLFLHQLDRDTSGSAGKAVADWISSRLPNLRSLTFGVTKKAQPAKEAKKKTSQIGLLPELSLAGHRELFALYLLGQLKEPNWKQLLPVSLQVLTLSGSKLEADMMAELGGLLKHLRTFRLLGNSFLGTSLKFARDGFPSLLILKIWKLPCLREVIVEQGAMPHLRVLELRHLKSLTIVEDIKECKELENIDITSESDTLVKELRGKIGVKTNLNFEEDIERSEDGDDSDDDTKATAPS
ncbi:hypothetical protein ACJRO7_005256 [Eucalyptus globulus]|uniref:Uncharacterized protein n=1 Tax=Eucalyptus globulus TaxID=34317 RepID=A0ABD3J259_EUCGL